MATQLKQPEPELEPTPEPEAAPEPKAEQERDYEAEARERGWTPLEEFKGDPSRFVDAKTFVERTDTVMPLLKADRDRLRRELSELKRQFKQVSKHMSGAEERIRTEIQAEMEAAVEAGDVAGFRQAQDKAKKLNGGSSQKYTEADLVSAFDEFREQNEWYDRANLASASDTDVAARLFADRVLERKLAAIPPGEEPPPDEFLAEVLAEVKAKFPNLGKAQAAPRQKPASDVGAPGVPGRQRNTRTWENLPPEVRTKFEKWEAQGMDRKVLLASFDWDGYAKEAAR